MANKSDKNPGQNDRHMSGKSVKMSANVMDNAGHSDIVTIAEAAVRLGKSERTIRRMISAGRLNSVEIGGKTCVQLAGMGKACDMSGESVNCPTHGGQNDRHMSGTVSDPIAEVLRDTVRRQDSEIAYLRTELTAIRATLETVTRMLPAPNSPGGDPARRAAPPWVWIVIAGSILAAGIGGYYWLWLTW